MKPPGPITPTYESTKHHGSDDVNTTDRSTPICNCGAPASKLVRMHNLPCEREPQPICEDCAARHESDAAEVNEHEMRNFGGAYGLVSWTYLPLPAAPQAPAEPHPQRPQEQEAPLVREGEGNTQYWHLRYLDSERHANMARIERDGARAMRDLLAENNAMTCRREEAAQATAERLDAALRAIMSSCIPGMNWTDEVGQMLLANARAALSSSAEAPRQHQEVTTPSASGARGPDWRGLAPPQAGDNDKGNA